MYALSATLTLMSATYPHIIKANIFQKNIKQKQKSLHKTFTEDSKTW